MNLLNEEHVHIGNNAIYKELWININTDQFYPDIVKPYGGLWCSKKNNEICDWLSYIKMEKPNYYDLVASKPSCLIKFKNDSKLLKIYDQNDLKNLLQSGFILDISNNPIVVNKYYYTYNINIIPQYEKISDYYDIIHINPYLDKCFKEYSIDTILCLNPNSIEYYTPIELDLDNNIIKKIDNKKTISEPNKDYYNYIKYIEQYFKTIDDVDYKKYINKLREIKKEILNNKDNLNFNINTNVNKSNILEAITENLYIKYYREKQKTLKKI